ncbi:hypothetical protein PFICI_05649 [Pestalotiopsis fici W106-1]|uniref:Uncharacterized protein n=1 Tax=Pestalotiopsis fici (strain W106-1 / CGMCC3.15140) TaxID=1229662 RepID=W3XCG3_PESFW|nr:uncharacterized protein PFICI_05649 [Pestalotiopsis fici W106-1]ETS83773.1 hypothetical protein PFICI_05649 [Pestalotiopsis fici W106-1]
MFHGQDSKTTLAAFQSARKRPVTVAFPEQLKMLFNRVTAAHRGGREPSSRADPRPGSPLPPQHHRGRMARRPFRAVLGSIEEELETALL